MKHPLRIAVLYGGDSPEREISLVSGGEVARALRSLGHVVTDIDALPDAVEAFDWRGVDVAFIAMHGGWGEGGGLQKWFEGRGVAFTGSDAESSGRAMDKWASSCIFRARGVATPPSVLVLPDDPLGDVRARARALEAPWVVKPSAAGSSVGVSIDVDDEGLGEALAKAFRYSPAALVQTRVRGRELTVGILQGKPLQPVEIVPARSFFDYSAKYADKGTEYIVSPDLTDAQRVDVLRAAHRAHRLLGCDGFSRVDVILAPDGEPWVLEVNTIPGLTPRSLLPLAARGAGIEFPELCERIVRMALRHASRPDAAAS